MEKVAIFGAAGPIGRYVGMELDRRGVPFRAVGRTASKLAEAFGKLPHAEVVAADLSDAGGATQAARGVDTIIYAVGVAYTEFQLHPKMMRVAVDAAAAAGVQRLVLVTGIYSYGVPQTKKVAETHPRVPVSVKGQLRKEQEDILMAAGERGLFKSMVFRRQIAEVVAVPGHAHDQIAMFLRLALRFPQGLRGHDVELDVVPVELEIRAHQVRQMVQPALALD